MASSTTKSHPHHENLANWSSKTIWQKKKLPDTSNRQKRQRKITRIDSHTPFNVRTPCKQPIGPEDGIRDQVWLGQATSRSRRKETERGGNTSRGNLLGPRSSAEARGPPILLHTGASRVRHHISTGHAVHLFPTNTHNRAILNKHHVPSKLRTGDVLIVTRLRRLPNAGPDSNAEADIPLRKTTILANFDEFRIPMVTTLICFDPDTRFCGWKYTSPWFTLEKPSRQIATTTPVLTPISSSLRRRKSTTARTSTTSGIQSQSTFPSASAAATRYSGNGPQHVF
uniref:Uncharacterized protein n=2 Tax=Caenorhabditis japonica TaxID=281687 RepID=A0A8R1IMC5_CAEJA